jgi:hypothetical protein
MKHYFPVQYHAVDTIDILLKGVPVGSKVYGREEEPGVIVIRDTITNDIYGVTIHGYRKYPDICKQSLIDLGLESVIEQLD